MSTKFTNTTAEDQASTFSGAEHQSYTIDNQPENYQGRVTMESGGVINMTNPSYVEGDDVMDSIAEGYF